MYTTTTISHDNKRAIMLRSHHPRSKKRIQAFINQKRKTSTFNTKSYNDAMQRAFNRAKMQVFFNPDMQHFVTLTYKGIEKDIDKAMHDVKILVKSERRKGHDLKYIYIFEWQKRGSLHIHMITNAQFTTYTNDNGYKSLTYWKHGYTSMLHIKDFDNNFRPHLYLFKYMKKSQRIGSTFVHSSRNINNFDQKDKHLNLNKWNTLSQEVTEVEVNGKRKKFYRNYLVYDTIEK